MKPERIQPPLGISLRLTDLGTLLGALRDAGEDIGPILTALWRVAKATPTEVDDRVVAWIAERVQAFGLEIDEPEPAPTAWDAVGDLFFTFGDAGARSALRLSAEEG